MDRKTTHVDLCARITDWWLRNDLFDPAGVFGNTAIFIESYPVRGGLAWVRAQQKQGKAGGGSSKAAIEGPALRGDGLAADAMVRLGAGTMADDERMLAGAYAFCDRVVEHQGVQGPPEALMMGYGLKIENGLPVHACVADQASIAEAVVETVELCPGHERAGVWRASIERWADWVLANFAKENGAIGVGIYCHQWNPISEYWCATSLTTAVLFVLARITGNDRYAQAGLRSLGWLGQFDYRHVEIPTFTDCAPEVVLYTCEGMVAGIRYLVEHEGVEAARRHPAARQFTAMAQWLHGNQDEHGRWPEPPDRGYRDYSCGIPWLLLRMDALIGPNPQWQETAARLLDNLAITDGERYYGLYVRPFTTGLAWLSACAATLGA